MRIAARALAPVAEHHQLVLSHGNGPQVGLLALQAAAYKEVEAYPLDVLGAQTEGMIGYLIEQELGNLLPAEVPVRHPPHDDRGRRRATRRSRDPTKFVGPIYDDEEAEALAADEGLGVQAGRRAPAPGGPVARAASASSRSGRSSGCSSTASLVICAGGGGIPTAWVPGEERTLAGVEAVIDKDLASALLARDLDADLFVMATDVDGVYADWGTPEQRRLDRVTPDELRERDVRRRVDGPEGRRRRRGSSRRPASAPPSARWRTSSGSWRAAPARPSCRASEAREDRAMSEFGVHSEVGKLRKVMVHRPDLSLQRLTPSNHDDLLFDDVLWVERAQYEHDQFVARMRERGVEVFLLTDLLAEALAASDEARTRLIELVASEHTVSWSLVDEVREPCSAASAGRARPAPDRRPDRRRVGPRPRRDRRGRR